MFALRSRVIMLVSLIAIISIPSQVVWANADQNTHQAANLKSSDSLELQGASLSAALAPESSNCTDPMECDPVSSQIALWRCNIPECSGGDWAGTVISWPSWSAYENNARPGDGSRTVYAQDGTTLYPYMGSWANGCQVTAVSGSVLIIEWQRGSPIWRETHVGTGQTHTIQLVSPEDNAMLESANSMDVFSVSLANCTPQNIRSTSTPTTTPTSTATSTATATGTPAPTQTSTATATPVNFPNIMSILRADSDPSSLSSVNFEVTFSSNVSGVSIADFVLTTTGTTGASIAGVSGSGSTYTVTVNTGSGNGTIRLDVVDDNSIQDVTSNPLGGASAGDGNYSSGESYTVIKVGVDVLVGTQLHNPYPLSSNSSIAKNYPDIMTGPVKMVSLDGSPFFTSQHVIYGNSFNELMGYPANKFSTEYWFPWYDQLNMRTWILVGNPSTTQTAYVDIYIAGTRRADTTGVVRTYSIAPGGNVTPQFPGMVNGPVRVVSVSGAGTSSPINIFASERSLYGTSFNEVMGYPFNQFVSEYWFPWYDQVNMSTWILVGNPSTTQTAYVDIYIGGVKRNDAPYAILPNGNITPQFPGVANGPVRVVSVTGSGTPTPLNIFASERSIYRTSFNEVMGIPLSQFTTDYWYPWYDNGSMSTWILVGNPSTTQTAYVDIYIGGVKVNDTPGGVPYAISANGRITPQFNLNNGPVHIVSVTGSGTPSPLNIFSSQRVVYGPSFNEMMGYPANQLTSEYWFTWYDNVNMQSKIYIGKP